MPTFKFVVAPKSGGDFTTRAQLGAQVDQTALTASIATAVSITAPQVEATLVAFFDKLLEAAEGNAWSDGLYGRVRFRPTAGGSKQAPSEFTTADDIKADVSISLLADAIRAWRARLNLDNQGTVGKVTPMISTVMNKANGHENEYTAGNVVKVIGQNLAFDPADPAQGLFFDPASGPEVRATVYGDIDPGSFTALVPAGATGPQTVRIAAFINGSLRSYTYTDPITPSA